MKYTNKGFMYVFNKFFILLILLTFTSKVYSAAVDSSSTPFFYEQQQTTSLSSKNLELAFPLDEIIEKPNEQDNRFIHEALNMLASLGLVIGIILIGAWFLKRFTNTRLEQANQTSLIKVLEKRTLSPKTLVYLLEVEGTSYLVAESVNGITPISEFAIAKEGLALPTSFEKILNQSRPSPLA